jgi:hypothetical protein
MDPQQELFSYLLVTLKKEYPDMVFDGVMPPEETPYPFIYLADSQLIDDFSNKSVIFGNVYQTIHVWHNNSRQRGTVSNIGSNIKDIARNLVYTDNFKWDIRNINQRIISDDSTSITLMHCVIEIEYKFSPKSKKINQGG